MKNIIYEDDRILVCTVATNGSKVTVSDKFGGSLTLNKEAFEKMCKEVAKKDEQ